MVEWSARRDLLKAFGGDPDRVTDLLFRAEEQPLFGKG